MYHTGVMSVGTRHATAELFVLYRYLHNICVNFLNMLLITIHLENPFPLLSNSQEKIITGWVNRREKKKSYLHYIKISMSVLLNIFPSTSI